MGEEELVRIRREEPGRRVDEERLRHLRRLPDVVGGEDGERPLALRGGGIALAAAVVRPEVVGAGGGVGGAGVVGGGVVGGGVVGGGVTGGGVTGGEAAGGKATP